MGEIIEFPGGRKAPEDESQPRKAYLNFELLIEMIVALTHLTSNVSHETRADIEGNVKGADDDELIEWTNTSSQNDWQRRPAFYRAVLQELRDRKLVPKPKKYKPEPEE